MKEPIRESNVTLLSHQPRVMGHNVTLLSRWPQVTFCDRSVTTNNPKEKRNDE